MAKLPSAEGAFVEERKVVDYLLNPSHHEGQSKARFFEARGFSRANWEQLRDALIHHGQSNEIVSNADDEFGKRVVVDCHCRTPDGTNPCIRTVWELNDSSPKPRLITAHPLGDGRRPPISAEGKRQADGGSP